MVMVCIKVNFFFFFFLPLLKLLVPSESQILPLLYTCTDSKSLLGRGNLLHRISLCQDITKAIEKLRKFCGTVS